MQSRAEKSSGGDCEHQMTMSSNKNEKASQTMNAQTTKHQDLASRTNKSQPASGRSSGSTSPAEDSAALSCSLATMGDDQLGRGSPGSLSSSSEEVSVLTFRQQQQQQHEADGKDAAREDKPAPISNAQVANQSGDSVEGAVLQARSKAPNLITKLVMPTSHELDGDNCAQPQLQGNFDLPYWSSPSSACSVSRDAGLLYYNREPLRLKDFHTEVRASMDVEQFAHQAELMLDVSEISMDDIIHAMLTKVVENDPKENSLDDIRDAIFIPGSSMLMARTIQGFSSVVEFEDRGHQTKASLKHDQSWLCALCNLAQVSKRHMVIARFKHPINMGENAHEVRLFVLIIVPTVEKSTKDQVETGRTFATMLTDAELRQKLLRAGSETEFKTHMLLKAQQLARKQKLKNRHKYQLDAALHHSISMTSLDEVGAGGGGGGGGGFDSQMSGGTPSGKSVFNELQRGEPARVRLSKSPIDPNRRAQNQQRELDRLYGDNPRTGKLFELMASAEQDERPNGDGNLDEGDVNKLKQRHVKHPAGANKQVGDVDKLESDTATQTSGCCFGLWQHLEFGKGAWGDFRRRLKSYPSDFRDAFVGPPRTLQKTVATIWFLYFGILLPTIAFSSLNTTQTHGHMGDLRKAIIGQAIGGLIFALLGGQPIVIIMTTAPLCLYTKVIHQMCLDYGFHFPEMYAAVGLWNGFFLIIYSLFGFSKLMKWCTRSTEEIFALFIVVAFVTDAGKDMVKNFTRFYFTPACDAQNNRTKSVMTDGNQSMLTQSEHLLHESNHSSHDRFRDIEDEIEGSVCRRETSLLFVLLMFGTLWLAVTLYKFRRTPYLSAGKRDILADYALPMAVILMSLVGATIFDDIYVEKFPPLIDIHFERARVETLPWTGVLTAMGLGFTLSLLFFMDQNISAAMVNAPQNKLKKGSAYHYDLLIVALLNGGLSLFGLPMMHGVLPHSPLHARSLADIEDQVEEGHLRQVVVNSRETRVTSMVAHVLVLGSLLLIPYPIAYIPRAVLNGLFLYMAITSLDGLQVFERILLLVTEQSKYPPNHYIRRCPQRKIHAFTMLQLAQLVVMCFFGFSPINIVEMFFPVIILLMIPFRHRVVPKYIDEKYLDALDGKH